MSVSCRMVPTVEPKTLYWKPLSIAKKFFHKTLQCFKSFLPARCQRLTNTPHFMGATSLNQSYKESCEPDQDEPRKRNKEKVASTEQPMKADICDGSFKKFMKQSSVGIREEEVKPETQKNYRRRPQDEERGQESYCCSAREGRSYMVVQKLRELEMMDVNDVDHVLDIEEVLHYYSRLTCPVYLDMVDRFFMEVYSEFFRP